MDFQKGTRVIFSSLLCFSLSFCINLDIINAQDTDGDSIPDSEDNCPNIFNQDQADADYDGLGDVCDNFPNTYPPMPEALDAMASDSFVSVSEVVVQEWEENSNFYYVFEPQGVNPTIGFIFYPGGLVDPVSYAPPIRKIAEEGYLAFIVKMPDDLAFLGYTRANTIIDNEDYSGITKWIIGGHSLGGAFSCAFAKDFSEQLDGITIWASYPSEMFRIDDKVLEAVLIYGTNNPNANDDEIEANRPYLPYDTIYVRIEGGNHTQFGWYDTFPNEIQEGDDYADITRQEQQDIIIQATVNFLNYFHLCPDDPDNDYDHDAVCGDVDNCPSLANVDQADNFPPQGNNIGDVCDCEGNFDCDNDCDGSDAATFKIDFGRNEFFGECTDLEPCNGDFDCDGDCDGTDAARFKEDFGRSEFNNVCPACEMGIEWCFYQ